MVQLLGLSPHGLSYVWTNCNPIPLFCSCTAQLSIIQLCKKSGLTVYGAWKNHRICSSWIGTYLSSKKKSRCQQSIVDLMTNGSIGDPLQGYPDPSLKSWRRKRMFGTKNGKKKKFFSKRTFFFALLWKEKFKMKFQKVSKNPLQKAKNPHNFNSKRSTIKLSGYKVWSAPLPLLIFNWGRCNKVPFSKMVPNR